MTRRRPSDPPLNLPPGHDHITDRDLKYCTKAEMVRILASGPANNDFVFQRRFAAMTGMIAYSPAPPGYPESYVILVYDFDNVAQEET